MNKRLLSMFLALCMIVTMLPVSAMAEEIHTTIGTSGEIISFAPLAETEETRALGTSIQDLVLPEILTVTVRTAVPADENPTQDSGSPDESVTSGDAAVATTSSAIEAELDEPEDTGEAAEPEWKETTMDIPVTWVSPDYDMNTEGEYVFTPKIEGYTVRAPLPEITVTVGEMLPIAAARGLVTPMSTTTDYNVWVGGVQVTSENKEDVLGTEDVGATVTYDPDTSTLTLRGATIIYSGGNTIYTVQQDLTVVLIGVNTVTSTSTADDTAFNTISGGSLTFRGDGRLTASGKYGGIYAYDDITIESGTISSTGQKAGICSNNGAIIISGGDVTSTATTSVGYGVKGDWWSALSLTVSGSATLTAIGTGGAKAIGSVNLNITHAVMAGNDASSAVPVPSPDADTWESAYVKLTPFAAVVLDSGGAAKDYYQTFAEALQNAVNGDIVRLLKEITLAVPATITNKSITLDLNGKKLTSAQVQTLAYISSPGDTLTITDSAGGGVVENTYASTQGKALVNSSTGTVEVISGTIRSTGVYGYGIHNASIGTITVSGGSVEATGDQYVSGLYYSARAIDNNGGGVVNISGTAQVTGVTGNGYAITSNMASGVVNISGGVVSSEKNFALGGSESGRIKGRVNITGGEIRSGIDLANGTTVNISGGTLAPGKISVPVYSTLVITGGNMGFNLYGGVAVNGQVPPVAVVPYVLTIPGEGNKAVTELTVTPELDYTYGMNDVKTDDSGNLTVCLPLGKTGVSVTIDGTTYSGETVRVSEEYSNWGYTATLTPPAPSYTITANPTTKDFGPLTIGYTAPAAQTVIITNTGNSSVTLTQPTSTSYTIGALSTTTLAAGGTATFTVAPKVGLAVGNYNETLTVSTNHSTNATVNLSFSVTAVPTYTITANPTSKNFGSLAVGYSAPTAQTMTITNTGNSSVTLTQPTSTSYTIGTLSTTTLAANGMATFTVTPKTGLAVGNYNETLTVSTNHSTNATVNLSFSVTAVPTYTITANPTSKNFGSLAVGYSAPTAQTMTITNTGNTSVTLTQPTSTNYTIGALSTTTLAANGTATFTVAPKVGLAVGNYNETLTVSTNHSTNATVELNFSATAAPTYIVTFNPNGGTVSETSRSVAPGTAVGALPTPTRSGSYRFDGWYTAASGGTQISASTTVSANMTYYAHWTYTGGGGSGGGGGSSSNDNSTPVIVTPPAPDKPNSPTQGEIKVTGAVDSKGNVTVSITGKTVTDAFDKALAEAKKNGTEQNGITVVLRVDTGNNTGSHVTVNLPKAVQDTIIAKKIVNTIVVVDNPDIRIGMDLATVQEINKQAKSDVNITATRADNGKLTGEAKKAIGIRPVFDLKVNYGNGKAVSSFGAGSVSVTIPYTLGANEKAGNVQAVYVDAKGKVHWLTNSVYDSVEKVLRFSTNHFSTYGIGYKQTNTAFKDIAGHWAKENIEFVVSRGLFSGTSNTTFSPNAAMTRGMFVTALGRLANADVSGYAKSSFTDIKSDAYYMGYIEWASKNSIVSGVGNRKFVPEQSITREQMAVIMSNYAKTIGYTLPKIHVENTFADNGKISNYAKEAVKQMQMAGVISGKNGNLFDPQGTATRAEVSAVLHRFVELAISSDTAQGWSMNDSGKWMYFKDGKPLTGKQNIDGSTYTFDQYGVTADVPKNLRYTTYTVQKGDSFWSIAHKLGCTMSELERLNNKSRFTFIHPGDVFRVPEK